MNTYFFKLRARCQQRTKRYYPLASAAVDAAAIDDAVVQRRLVDDL